MTKILIGVCTYNRPKMLAMCLQSLIKQQLPVGAEIALCVADNNSESIHNIKEIVDTELANYNYKYIFVAKRGISHARNAIVEYAAQVNVDFIAFIDDDEQAAQDWIKNLFDKINSSGVDVVQGKVIYTLPSDTKEIIQAAWHVSHDEDTILKHVATNNVIFRKKLIQEWQLRFNEALALTGGEDLDFFMKSSHSGGRHIFTNKAIVYETVPEIRATIKWQLKRKMQDGFAVSYVMYLNRGKWFVFRKYVIKSIKNIITAPLYIAAGIFLNRESLQFRGLQKLFHAIGCLAFAFNVPINSYKKITGG